MTLMCSSGRISEEKHLCSGLWKYQLSNLPVAEKKYDIQPRSRLHPLSLPTVIFRVQLTAVGTRRNRFSLTTTTDNLILQT